MDKKDSVYTLWLVIIIIWIELKLNSNYEINSYEFKLNSKYEINSYEFKLYSDDEFNSSDVNWILSMKLTQLN